MKTASFMYTLNRRTYQRDYGAYPLTFYEVRVLQGNNEYTLHELLSVKITQSLISSGGINIGNANSSVCKIIVKEASSNWPRMAQFTVQFRNVSLENNIYSEWITAGVFYTDERSEDNGGNLLITGYDSMLMLEQTWTDKIPQQQLPASFPITSKAWATMIQNAGLANFGDLTQLDDTIAVVGLNTSSTIRDVLKNIAVVHGGNWTIIGTNTLTLVPYVNVTSSEATKYVTLGYDGIQAMRFETSPAFSAVSGVHLETNAGSVMEAGDSTGYTVKSVCSVATTAGVAALCLSKLSGYIYRPFSAVGARIDPLVDLGDSVLIGEVMYQITSLDWNFSKMVTATVSAVYDQEIDHEYTIPGEDQQIYRKTLSLVNDQMENYVPYDQFATAIEQNEQAVVIAASHTYVTQTVFNQEIASIQSQLDGSIQTWSGNAVPTLNNSPASNWTTDALKAEHVGDTYFVNSDAGIPEAGNYYRFEVNNGVYSWQLLTDSALTEALAKAAAALAAAEDAQDTADASMTEAQMKGRIFVSQPTDSQAYDIGDLWVNATYGSTYSNDVLRCKIAKVSGDAFNISHWEKASKYTDDTAVNTLRQEVESEFSVQADNIAAKVSRRGGSNISNSFSWVLDDTGHNWYANGAQDPVVSITGTGLAVKGEVNATSGFIGNGSYGFTIGATSIYNGMTSMGDTEHFGVYVGTDGIALGKGAFRVTSSGQLFAQSGTFEGNVYAKNINYGGDYGTLSGVGITPYTIGDTNIARAGDYGALTTAALSQGVQGSLALADGYGLATTQGTTHYPANFTAGRINAFTAFYSGTYNVQEQGEVVFDLAAHYHAITVDSNGNVQLGAPQSARPDPFNVADTKAYQDGVSAVTISSGNVVATTGSNVGSYSTGFDFDLTNYLYTPPASPNIAFGRIEIKNASGTLLKRIRVQVPNNTTSVTVTGASGLASSSSDYTTYDLAVSFAASSIYTSGSTQYARTQVTLSNGNAAIIRAGIPDPSGSVTAQSITGVTTDSTNYTTYDLTVNRSAAQIYTTSSYQYGRATITLSNGNTSTIRMRMPNQSGLVTISGAAGLTTTSSDYTTYDKAVSFAASSLYDSGSTLYARTQVTLSNGTTSIIRAAIPDTSTSVAMSSVTGLTTSSTDYTTYDFTVSRGASTLYTIGSYTYGRATIALSNGNTSTLRFRVPSISGVNSITVDRPTGTSDDWEIEDNNVFVKVNLAAKNGTTIVYSDTGRVNVNDIVNFWAEEAYDHAGTLVTNSSNYTTYDTGYSWGTRLFNPTLSSGGSSVYGRLGIYNSSNSLLATLRLALSMSVVSASTASDPSDYYQSGGSWYLKVHVKNSSTEIYQGSVNVQQAVNYGGSLNWDIHQHYDMGQADGWDCVVTTGSGQTHTFWSPSRIYQ